MDAFRKWVLSTGVQLVAGGVGVTPSVVYQWLQGKKYPSRQSAAIMIRLSKGILDYNVIMAHRRAEAKWTQRTMQKRAGK
jgi:hypothetical protein